MVIFTKMPSEVREAQQLSKAVSFQFSQMQLQNSLGLSCVILYIYCLPSGLVDS